MNELGNEEMKLENNPLVYGWARNDYLVYYLPFYEKYYNVCPKM